MAEDLAERDEAAEAMARLDAVLAAVALRDEAAVEDLLAPLHPADVADLLEQSRPLTGRTSWRCGTAGSTARWLSEIDEAIREEVIEALPRRWCRWRCASWTPTIVVDILEDLDAPAQGRILDALEDADRVAVEQSLPFRRQRRAVDAARDGGGTAHWSVGEGN